MRSSLFVLVLGLTLGLASCDSLPRNSRPTEATDHSTPDNPVQNARPEFQIVPLQFASAEETAKVLNDFFVKGAPPKGEPSIRIVADLRTNSLLVQAPSQQLPHVLEMIAKLDRKVP